MLSASVTTTNLYQGAYPQDYEAMTTSGKERLIRDPQREVKELTGPATISLAFTFSGKDFLNFSEIMPISLFGDEFEEDLPRPRTLFDWNDDEVHWEPFSDRKGRIDYDRWLFRHFYSGHAGAEWSRQRRSLRAPHKSSVLTLFPMEAFFPLKWIARRVIDYLNHRNSGKRVLDISQIRGLDEVRLFADEHYVGQEAVLPWTPIAEGLRVLREEE